MLNAQDNPSEFYDLLLDPNETVNLIPELVHTPIPTILGWSEFSKNAQITLTDVIGIDSNFTTRKSSSIHRFVVAMIYNRLKDFAEFGNEAHQSYLKRNSGRIYVPTVESDTRYANGGNIYKKTSRANAAAIRQSTIVQGQCSTPCSCKVPSIYEVPTLPFHAVTPAHQYLNPTGCINATQILFG
jgi:hypothetical protein